MTDKEKIIIDAVDVSECEYVCNTAFGNIGCKLPFSEEIHCCNIPNCYYKQLQRKDQECEELKKEQLEIKKYLGISHKSILERLEELQERRDELSDKNLSYEQALNEIYLIIDEIKEQYDILEISELEQIKDIITKAKENNQ